MNPPGIVKIHIMLNKCAQNCGYYHELPFDPLFNNYLICGHTHRRVIGEVVPGFMGVNVGSDYDDLKTFTLEVWQNAGPFRKTGSLTAPMMPARPKVRKYHVEFLLSPSR